MSYKRLNEPKLLSWAVDFMVSGEFFMCLWEQMSPPLCGGSQFGPHGHGWQDLHSEPTMHGYILNIETVGFMVSEKIL